MNKKPSYRELEQRIIELEKRISISEDISGRKQADEAIRISEEKFKRFFERLPYPLCYVDEDGKIIIRNDRFIETFGYTEKDVPSLKEWWNKAYPDKEYRKWVIQNWENAVREAAKTGNDIKSDEYKVSCKDGKVRNIIISGITIENNFMATFIDITDLKRAEELLEKRVISLTQPLDDTSSIGFEDLFNMDDIQQLQDDFALATGVASIITSVDGRPITEPSNFTHLCNDIIRKTEKGCANCFKSDAALGKFNPDGPIIQPCLSGGLWDAGAAISVGGKHIANWLIGQVRDESQTEEKMREYAREIETDEETFVKAFYEVPCMSIEQFNLVSKSLFTLAKQLSTLAYQSVQQARYITDRKQAEEKLRKSEERYRSLIEVTTSIVWTTDETGGFVTPQPSWEDFTGQPWSEHKGFGWINKIHPDDKEHILIEWNKAIKTKSLYETYGRVWSQKQEAWRDFEVKATPLINQNGTLREWVGIITDISERKKAEQELIKAKEKTVKQSDLLDFIFDNTLDSIVLLDKDYNFIKVSQSYADACQRDITEFEGKNHFELYPSDLKDEFDFHKKEKTIYSRKNRPFEFSDHPEWGITYWDLGLVPLFDYKNDIEFFIFTLKDVTEQTVAEKKLKESEERFRMVLQGSSIITASFDTDLRYTWVYNPHPDFNASELIGKRDNEITDNEGTCQLTDLKQRTIDTGMPKSAEINFPMSTGEITYTVNVQPVKDDSGKIIGGKSVSYDITERKQHEEERKLFLEMLELLNEQTGLQETMQSLLKFMQEMSGCEAVGIRLRDGNDFPYYETRGFTEDFVEAERSLCTQEMDGQLQLDEVGNPVLECMCGNIICGRFNPSLSCFTDFGSFVSNSTSRLLADTTEEDHQARTLNRCHSEGYESVMLVPLRSGGETLGLLQFNDLRKDRFSDAFVSLVERLAGDVGLALAKRRAEESLRARGLQLKETNQKLLETIERLNESENSYSSLFNLSRDGYVINKGNGELLSPNPAYLEMIGYTYDEFKTINWQKITPKKWLDWELETQAPLLLERGYTDLYEKEYIRKDGERITVEVQGFLIKEAENLDEAVIAASVRDITERKQAEKEKEELQKQLNHKSQMDAIGQLAGGMAHDFNNVLGGILNASQLLQLPKHGLNKTSLKYVDLIIQASLRASDLISKLLVFSRKGNMAKSTNNIHEVLNDTADILKGTIDKKISILLIEEAQNQYFVGDFSAIESAFINLGINASHAMPDGGVIEIKTKNIFLDLKYCDSSSFEIEPGDFIQIEIKDTGSGIPEENLQKIFDPFFTTKEQGKGTGLGLSVVYGTIQNHQGEIEVHSKVGKGTTFYIQLPCSRQSTGKIEEMGSMMKGAGTVLLVDDEEFNRILNNDILESLGYKVILAENGQEAVEIFSKKHSEIDIVLMDMIMPRMNGSEAFYKMKDIDENCNVIIASGYTKDEKIDGLIENGVKGFINKPYKISEISQVLDEVIKF